MSDSDRGWDEDLPASPFPMSEHGMMMTLPPGSLLPDGALRSPETSLPVGTRLGEFEITGLIGEGGFGIVYLTTDHLLGRQVALKEYMPSALATRGARAQVGVKSERLAETFEAGRRSFINEARLLAQFDHPALVKVFRFWEANGTAYMVMPYYRGRTLRQALADMGAAPPQAWLQRILLPLIEALETLHAVNCFHRDIAPDNILLLDNGRPVLLDFGAARRVIGDITQALTVILKPGFAPVEQYASGPEMKQGPWTDVYALAAVIYYCATLKTPVPSVARMMNDTLQSFSELAGDRYDAQFCAAVDRGLAVTVEERVQDMAEFREALGLDFGASGERTHIPATSQFAARPLASGSQGAGNPASQLFATELGFEPFAPGRNGQDRDAELEATIIDPSGFLRKGGAASTGRDGNASITGPDRPQRLNEGNSVDTSPPVQERAEKPWTPNADVQLERVTAESEASSRRGGIAWLPVAALVVLAGGAGGYWFLSQSQGDSVTTPPVSAPSVSAPSVTAPSVTAPSVTAPSVTAPSVSAPSVTAPTFSTPSITAPTITAPSVSAPSVTIPSVTTPPLTEWTLVPKDQQPIDPPSGVPGTSGDPGSGLLPVGTLIDLLHQQRDVDWPVSVQVTAARVRIGKDRLRFRLRSERDGYVYLLMQGTDRSHFFQLFPNGLDQNNRLRANAEMALPRANWEMVAGGPAGKNRFVALVTPTPRNFAAAGLNSSQPFSGFDIQTAARIFNERGAGPFAGEPVGCKLDERSCAVYGAALFEIEEY